MINKLKKMQKSAYLAVAFAAVSNSALAADGASTGIDWGAIAGSINFSTILAAIGVIVTASFGVRVAMKGISYMKTALSFS